MREVIFDTETTGLDPQVGDRLVEIGCIEMVNRVETGRTFHAYFNHDRAMAAAAEAINGLVDDFLIVEGDRVVNVCNAPSPAATASLQIGATIVDRLSPRYT